MSTFTQNWRIYGAIVILLCSFNLPVRMVSAQLPAPVSTERSGHPRRDHLLLLTAGVVGAASFNQAVDLPEGWNQDWGGFGARLADQVAFAGAEESLRWVIGRAVPWRAVPVPCAGARAGRAMIRRAWSASVCALRDVAVVRDQAGAAHPNLPLLGAVTGASLLSLAWRPERADAAKGQLFVASRIGIVLGGTALTNAVRYR
jgi:hypothetical protein